MTTDNTAWHKSACILCENNCGIQIQTDGRRFAKIRGDKDHVATAGYTCNKALRLDHYQNGGARLTTPLRREQDGTFTPIAWDTAIREIAAWHAFTPARSASTRGFNREDEEYDQSATPVAVQIQDLILDARMARTLTTIVDSTNLHAHVRAGLLARARYWQRPTTAILFDTPLATVEEQNAGRDPDRMVPQHVVRQLHQLLPTSTQLRDEGFTTIHLASDTAPAR